MAAGGAMLNGQNAVDKTKAANASAAANIGKLDTLGATNQKTLGDNLATYSPTNQSTQLAGAQTARSNADVANISTPDKAVSDTPISPNAPASVRTSLAKTMGVAYDNAVKRAQAMGKLGGYGDTWLTNQLANRDAANRIALTNVDAAGRKALVQPEQQLAIAGTGNSPLGSILEGGGSLLGSMSGVKGGSPSNINNMPSFPGIFNFNGQMSS